MTLLAYFKSLLPLFEGKTGVGSMAVSAVSRRLVFQVDGSLSMVILEISSLLYRMAKTAHLGHPSSQFEAGLIRNGVMGDMTVSAGRCIFLFFYQRFCMCPFKIALVFLGMASFTFLIVIEKR
jgi:hypothetical protein